MRKKEAASSTLHSWPSGVGWRKEEDAFLSPLVQNQVVALAWTRASFPPSLVRSFRQWFSPRATKGGERTPLLLLSPLSPPFGHHHSSLGQEGMGRGAAQLLVSCFRRGSPKM